MKTLIAIALVTFVSQLSYACPNFSGIYSFDLKQTDPNWEGVLIIKRTQYDCVSTKIEMLDKDTRQPKASVLIPHDGIFYPDLSVTGEVSASKFVENRLNETIYYRPTGAMYDKFISQDPKTGDLIDNETIYRNNNEPIKRATVWKKVN